MGVDIKDFYLNTPMKRYEYTHLPISLIPNKIIRPFHLKDLVTDDGWVHMEICKGVYGLEQTGLLANI
jgi:hypothetical protein